MHFSHSLRNLLALLLVALCLNMSPADAQTMRPKLSLQLWSVKDDLKKDFQGTMKQVAAMGFEGVEFAGDFGPYGTNPQGLKNLLDSLKLRVAGAHVSFEKLNEKNFFATVAFYKTIGCSNLVIPWDDRVGSKEGSLQIARELTMLDSQLRAFGMRTGYHNHYEEMSDVDGQTFWDILALNTPKDVILQQDVGWTTYAGKDPILFVKKYPGRTTLTHYKAKFLKGRKGVPIIGRDSIAWAELYVANRDVGGTEWLTVEQEEYPTGMTPLESVKASFEGLQKVISNVENHNKK